MSAPCIHCGLPADEHHAFEAKPAPSGCVCDPGTWGPHIDPVCAKYDPPVGKVDGYCVTCEHDRACHRGAS